MVLCQHCHKEIYVNPLDGRTHKYHPKCAREVEKERDREYHRRQKEKQNKKISSFTYLTDEEWWASSYYKKILKRLT